MSSRHIVIAMSGGVDSSVSAALLKEQGYQVTGVSLQLYDPIPKEPGCKMKTCCSLDDVLDAGRVAKKLGIPFEVIDMRAEFKALVIDYFISEYSSGRTPNPCIRCNDLIKFNLLLQKAQELGADLLATGHYARVELDVSGLFCLKTGLDPAKDQSYFLFTLRQEQLQHVVFPVGMLEKSKVRQLAADFMLPVAQKHESQEICFIPDNDYVKFLETHGVSTNSGEIVTMDGTVVGQHTGTHQFTIGQRKGIGIAWKHPLHVVALDTGLNCVVVGGREDLYHQTLTAGNATWSITPKTSEFRATCKIRYRHTATPCVVTQFSDNRFGVRFDHPQTAITPGQAAVLYDEDLVLGGGWIE